MSLLLASNENHSPPTPAILEASDAYSETAQYDRETCGRIIGPGGVTIKAIREQSGCKIVVSNESVDGMQTVSLEGTHAQVRAAKEKLTAVVAALHAEGASGKIDGRIAAPPVVVNQLFAKSQVSRLIGPGGATIRRLRDTSRAFIKIDNEDQPPPPGTTEPCQQLRVTGTDSQVQLALALIHEILNTDSGIPKENIEGKHEIVRSIAKDQVRRLIGQGGATIRKLRDTSRAFIKIDNDEIPPAAGETSIRQQMRIIGTDAQVATALQLINDLLADFPAAAPTACCSTSAAVSTMSHNNSGTASLSSSYSSSSSLPSADNATIPAPSPAFASSAVVRTIPKEQARRLIGPGGATIRRLRDASRAFIKIDNEDLPPPPGTTEPCQQLRVTGTELQVQVALGMIDDLLASPLGSELPVSSQRSDLAISAAPTEAAYAKTEMQRAVPKSQVSRLIGPGGATIRRLRDASRAFIKIDNEDQPPPPGTNEPCQQLRVTGTDSQVQVALALINEILAQVPTPAPTQDSPTAEVSRVITKEQARRLIGPGGSTIRRMRDTSRAYIKIDNEDLPPLPGTIEPCQQLRVTGTDAQVQVAITLIDEVLLQPLAPVSSISSLQRPHRTPGTPMDAPSKATPVNGFANATDAISVPAAPPPPPPTVPPLLSHSLLSHLHFPPSTPSPLPFLQQQPFPQARQPLQHIPAPPLPPAPAPAPNGLGALPLLPSSNLTASFSSSVAASVASTSPITSMMPMSSAPSWLSPRLQAGLSLPNTLANGGTEEALSKSTFGAFNRLRHALVEPCARMIFDEASLPALLAGNPAVAPAPSPVQTSHAAFGPPAGIDAASNSFRNGHHGINGASRKADAPAPCSTVSPTTGATFAAAGHTNGVIPHSVLAAFSAAPSVAPHLPSADHGGFLRGMLTAHREFSRPAPIAACGNSSSLPPDLCFDNDAPW